MNAGFTRSWQNEQLEDDMATEHAVGAIEPETNDRDLSVAAQAANGNLPAVLTPPELAALLRIRRRSVYEAIRRGDIPGVRRIGRKVRIDRHTVLRWLADGQGRVSRSPRR